MAAWLGIYLIAKDGLSLHANMGTALGIFCGFTQATTQLCLGLRVTKGQPTGYEALQTVILANLLMFLIGLPSIVASIGVLSNSEWFLLLLLGIIPWGIPDVMYTLGIRRVPVFRALILGLSDPVLTAVWPAVFLSEFPTVAATFGAGIILIAIVYQAFFRYRLSPVMLK
jgi:drug/metabolite transporter (DMT)-like permease